MSRIQSINSESLRTQCFLFACFSLLVLHNFCKIVETINLRIYLITYLMIVLQLFSEKQEAEKMLV